MARVNRLAAIVALYAGMAAAPCPGAKAQLMLPGAVAPTPQGTTQAPKPVKPKPQAPADADGPPVRRGVPVAVPGMASLAGKALTLNGRASQMVFGAAPDRSVAVTRLSLAGDKISNSRETCHVEGGPTALPVTPLGRLNGLQRFQLGYPACMVAFDVLDGAILVDRTQPACEVATADCRVSLAGLWGPLPSELGPDKVKSLERVRAAAESAVRSNFKALTSSTKDRPAIMGFAHEQAQFSSSREEVCRDYADEARHGYCAAKLTEARAARLHDDLAAALDAKAARKAARRGGAKQ